MLEKDKLMASLAFLKALYKLSSDPLCRHPLLNIMLARLAGWEVKKPSEPEYFEEWWGIQPGSEASLLIPTFRNDLTHAFTLIPAQWNQYITMPHIHRYTVDLWQAGLGVAKHPCVAYAKDPAHAIVLMSIKARILMLDPDWRE